MDTFNKDMKRAMNLICYGMTMKDIIARLMSDGLDDQAAYLAFAAARTMMKFEK